MMKKEDYPRKYSKNKGFLKQILIILTLLVLTSCSIFSSLIRSANPPANLLIEVPEDTLLIKGEMSVSQYQAAKNLAIKAPAETEIFAREGVINSVITGLPALTDQSFEERVESYFENNSELYQISQFDQNFQQVNQFDQPNGILIKQYQQVYNDIPVYQSDIRVAFDDQGSITLVNSNYTPDAFLPDSISPKMDSITARAAFEALNFYLPQGVMPTLVIYSPIMVGQQIPAYLAWVCVASWDEDYGEVIIKDADGSLISTSTYITTFSYEIRDYQNEELNEEDFDTYPTIKKINSKPLLAASTPGNYPDIDQVDHLIEYYSKVVDYYQTNFSYSEFNDMDSKLTILVNLSIEGNNFFDKGSPFSVYSVEYDIPPVIAYTDPASEKGIDVFAHEFQHLVTKDFVILESNYPNPQASALKEALSDFFAAVADPSKERWQITLRGKTIRDMQDPVNGTKETYPDHFEKFIYPKPNKEGEDSYGNGHLNATIYSHALYLLSEGGEKSGIKVFGIGIENAAMIVFRSLPLLQTNAKFIEARNAMLISCSALEFSENYCNQVRNAFAAVGIGNSAHEYNTPIDNLQGLQFGWALSPNLQLSNTFRAYEDIANIGFKLVQEIFPWDQIQIRPNGDINLDFGANSIDLWKGYIRENNLEVMATLIGAPWDTNISDQEFLRFWRSYLYEIVSELSDTVDYWQIGSQVNTVAFWKSVRPNATFVDPALYAEMLKIAYEVIKVTERNDLVVFGGLNNLGNSEYLGLDPLEFLKETLSNCQTGCFDVVGLYIEWGDYLPDESRNMIWGGKQVSVDVQAYIDIAARDIATLTGDSIPIWVTEINLDPEWPARLAEKKQIELYEAQTEVILKTIVTLASNKAIEVVFYHDILDYDRTRVVGQPIHSLVYLLSSSEPLGTFPVYSPDGSVLDQVHQYRFRRDNAPDVTFLWTDDPMIHGAPAKVDTLEDINANMQRFTDFPDAGEIINISFKSEFYIQEGAMLLLADMDSNDKLIISQSTPIEYGQIKIWNWNDPEFYLTYDKAKWEPTEYNSLDSKLYSDCNIASDGYRDGGPDGPPPYTYESDTHFLAETEFILDLEIPKSTGVPDMIHVYWDDYAYKLALFPSTEHYDECVAEFWEVMELSIANNFGQ